VKANKQPNLNNLKESLEWLAKRGFLSGSYGRDDGTGTGKDIDVRLADRHVLELKKMLIDQRVAWSSPFMGCITWHPGGTQVETAFIFPRYKNGEKTVLGVPFKT